MTLFIKLLLAHLLGDFLLQPGKWVIHKSANKIGSPYLYLHVLIHFSLVLILLGNYTHWRIALVIALSHFVIDLGKLYSESAFTNRAVPFVVDQFLHLLVLFGCAYYGNIIGQLDYLLGLVDWGLVTAVFFLTFPSAILMNILLEKMSDQISLDHKSLPNAGKYIGMIERLFVLIFILTGRWEGIGLLITAKSVFRFNDLKESNSRKLTEYILIGTLLSFGLAIVTGLIYLRF
ncbi:Protein of unknown function [Muriicola jejuensis]|uniref:DUF3307 domain-containing protein n=1 Tax=Muriicola jejuensis TaxID=504488 RepID=A0A6P0UGK0_9FLAO|nr:DUF3307 domain-containing protein [Muriicola jejuensis]NER10999.1 DUF3307 domain-containing protein [Muriicola jejuensis]SMP14861.1 Protein of unknown function [Muriicola jejuensis]